MVIGIYIIFLLGTILYSSSSPDPESNPLDEININLNLGEGTIGKISPQLGLDYAGHNKYGSYKHGYKKYWYKKGQYKKFGIKGTHCKSKIMIPLNNTESMDIADGTKIYAGFFNPSSGPSFTIKFNICKKGSNNEQYDCSHPGGEHFYLGGRNKTLGPITNFMPSKWDVTENAKKAGITKVDDLRFAITSIDTEIDGEIAQPIRVFRTFPRTVDYYTIFFNTSVTQPPAIIIHNGTRFKIESPNEKIYQVNTDDDYNNCNKQKFYCLRPNFYMDKWNGMDIGSYHIFDKDGLPKSCAGGAASNGSKVKLIIE